MDSPSKKNENLLRVTGCGYTVRKKGGKRKKGQAKNNEKMVIFSD